MLFLQDVVLGFYSIGDVDVTQQSLACVCVCVCVCVGGAVGAEVAPAFPTPAVSRGRRPAPGSASFRRKPPRGGAIDLKTARKAFPEPASLPIRLLPLLW